MLELKKRTSSPMAWRSRLTIKTDVDALSSLTHLIYGDMWKRGSNSAYYQWKFHSKGIPEPSGWVAVADKKIVGFQSSCHRRFRFGPKTVYSTELGDSMTHPDFRRQGIWYAITDKVINGAMKRGFFPVIGFPNRYSYQGYINKLKMKHFFSLWRLALFLKPPPQDLLPIRYRPLRNIAHSTIALYAKAQTPIRRRRDPAIHIEKNPRIDAWADHLWAMEAKHMEAGVVKNQTYLRWRFEDNPDEYSVYLAKSSEGVPLGFLITKIRNLKSMGNFGFIADMMVPGRDTKVLYRLLSEAEKDFRKAGVLMIDAWTTSMRFNLYSLLRFGFLPIARLPFIVPTSQAERLRIKGWQHSRRWSLTMADSDNI